MCVYGCVSVLLYRVLPLERGDAMGGPHSRPLSTGDGSSAAQYEMVLRWRWWQAMLPLCHTHTALGHLQKVSSCNSRYRIKKNIAWCDYIKESRKNFIHMNLSLKPSPGGYCASPLSYLSLAPSCGRLWDCMRSVLRRQDSVAELGAAVMQQADAAALWLLEALVLTLPQSLLQAYVVVSTDVGIMSPGTLVLAHTLFLACHVLKTASA